MQIISIDELKHFSPEIISQYLHHEGGNNITLHLYKKHTETWYNQKGIFWNYTIAAWAGKLLFDCCKQFSCTAPEAGDKLLPFSFTLLNCDMQQLALVLYRMATGLYGHKKEVLKFHALASYHFENVYYHKQYSPVKPLIEIANKYLEQLM